MNKRRFWAFGGFIVLCVGLYMVASLLVPQKVTSAKRKAASFVASWIPHDVTVSKPAGMVSFPDIVRTVLISPTPTLPPASSTYARTDMKHYYQTWNNCGPATLATALSAYGITKTQQQIADAVKPDADDKNVASEELLQYAQENTDVQGLYRANGTVELVKQLASHNHVVMLETWFEPKPNDGMGHFRLVTGYDESKRVFYLSDSYDGPKITVPYDQVERDWQVFGYTYIVFYRAAAENEVKSLIGADVDEQTNWERLLARSESLLGENKQNAFAWFMRGKAQTHLGKHTDAALSFDTARTLGLPWRMLWYQFELFDAYLAVGRYDDVITLTNANLRLASNLEESWYYKAKALEKQGKTKEAADAMAKVTQYNPNYFQYHER